MTIYFSDEVMNTHFGPVSTTDTQVPPHLTFDHPFIDDGECVIKYGKNNEKILRLLVFEL